MAARTIDSTLFGRVFIFLVCMFYYLDPAMRTRLKPSWRVMTDPVAVAAPPTDQALADRARVAERTVREARAVVATTAGEELCGRILEIGCYDGSTAYQLARRPDADVVGSDLARYYVVQRPGEPTDAEVAAQEAALAGIRERARDAVVTTTDDEVPGAVRFVEDDITASGLEPGSFDAIVSFEVLEHVIDPAAAFAAMARLLRPGGLLYHEYNPFFAANGGHSLCTLDFPWGHARLDDGDFDRYLVEVRPTEHDQALRFYRQSLNRMTRRDLESGLAAAGLELLALLPWPDRSLAPQATPAVLSEVRATYPDVTLDDLLATFVTVVARRPPIQAGQVDRRPADAIGAARSGA